MSEKESDEKNQDESKPTPVWEWIIAAGGLVLVAAAIGYTLYRAATEAKTPPQLSVAHDAPVPSGDGYLVKFRVKNDGNQTAAAVTVEGELKNENDTETATATIAYAPANSERGGGLYFTKNPQSPAALKIRVTGYEEP